jgi:hypothetical protein
MEEWKICFENYEISNLGNCRKGDKIIDGSIQNKGYRYFQVQRDNKRINLLFHHLVAKCFIGDRPENLVIDHKDQNKLNNNVDNLHYITQEENMKNTCRYRTDIETTDKKERHKIFNKEFRIRIGKNRGIKKPKGEGSIIKRFNKWRAQIGINKINYKKDCDTEEEAKQFINDKKSLVI